ncbi:MAG: hypothetical protein CME62_13435 [Halobacteriovoraceae bacterium]|nr:hypothetical protein [Halobacteriovoraceae bacterium]|tara:strand:- start:10517 stop:10843 length:327 start_codon:yes stop_codon:yes gene_type:complete
MKLILTLAIVIFSLSFSLSALAADCEINSVYSELETGLNKDVICKTVMDELKSRGLPEGAYLLIEANGRRTTYTVELTNVMYLLNGQALYAGQGMLNWNPDGEWVTLE